MKHGEQYVHKTYGICTFIKMIDIDTVEIKTNSGNIERCHVSELTAQLIFS